MDLNLQKKALMKIDKTIKELESEISVLNGGEDYERLKGALNKFYSIKARVINGDDILIGIVLEEL